MFIDILQNDRLETLSFSGELFPKASDRDFWGNDPQWIAEAEAYLQYDWPCIKATDWLAFRTTGNRLAQETPHYARRRALECLLLGELSEHEGRFVPDIINGMLAICEETYWGVSAHVPQPYFPMADTVYIDLFSAETAALLASVRYILGEKLEAFCPELVARVDYEIDRRIVTPYLEHTDFWWMNYDGGVVNNWNPWIISNLFKVFLLQVKDRRVLNTGLRKMLVEIERYYAAMPNDGGCDEGCLYWTRAGGSLFEFCDTLYRATEGEIDVFADAKLREILRYEMRAYIGNGWFVNFADGAAHLRGSLGCATLLYAIGERLQEDTLCDLGGELYRLFGNDGKERRINNLPMAIRQRRYGNAIAARPAFRAPQMIVLPQLQNAFVRSGDWYYAIKGGNNGESHNHNDVGNVIVFFGNRPLLVDPGCGVYTKDTFDSEKRYTIWTMRSPWHTLPLVNGCEQVYGPNYAAEWFSARGTESRVSFAAAYPAEARLTALERRVTAECGITFEDTFVFQTEENTVTEYMMTPLEVRVEGNRAVLGEEFYLAADTTCSVTVERVEFNGDAHLNQCWEQDYLYRIGFTFAMGEKATIALQLRRL